MKDSNRSRGFTLLEVLVALVIVAFGMGALMATLTAAAGSVEHLREKSFAEWVALNRISEVRLGKAAPASGKTSGDSELGGRRWRWTQNITPTGLANMIRIDVSVTREGAKPDDETAQVAFATGFTSPPGTLTANDGLTPDWSLDALAAQAASQQGGGSNGQGQPGSPSTPAAPGGAPANNGSTPLVNPASRQ